MPTGPQPRLPPNNGCSVPSLPFVPRLCGFSHSFICRRRRHLPTCLLQHRPGVCHQCHRNVNIPKGGLTMGNITPSAWTQNRLNPPTASSRVFIFAVILILCKFQPSLFLENIILQPHFYTHMQKIPLYCFLIRCLSPTSEKTVTSNKNPSKPPVISVPPKAPEDKTANTHFGVVIHDRGERGSAPPVSSAPARTVTAGTRRASPASC